VLAASPTPPGLSEAKHEVPVERNPVNPSNWVWTYRPKTGLGTPPNPSGQNLIRGRVFDNFVFFGIKNHTKYS
jgi:hypothetical protein